MNEVSNVVELSNEDISSDVEMEKLEDEEEMEQLREGLRKTADTFNRFCTRNGVISPFVNPTNHLPVDEFGYALIDISLRRDELRKLKDEVVVPINGHYKEITGCDEEYMDIGEIVRECFVVGLNQMKQSCPYSRYRKEMLEYVERHGSPSTTTEKS